MIRIMTMDDYDKLVEIWQHTPGMGLRKIDDSREGIARFLARNPDTNFTAWEDGQLVGGIMCGQDGRRGYIYHTVVLPEYRGRGIGSQLVAAVVQALRKEGITRVSLNVLNSNATGRKFWESKGWELRTFLGFFGKSITDEDNGRL